MTRTSPYVGSSHANIQLKNTTTTALHTACLALASSDCTMKSKRFRSQILQQLFQNYSLTFTLPKTEFWTDTHEIVVINIFNYWFFVAMLVLWSTLSFFKGAKGLWVRVQLERKFKLWVNRIRPVR